MEDKVRNLPEYELNKLIHLNKGNQCQNAKKNIESKNNLEGKMAGSK